MRRCNLWTRSVLGEEKLRKNMKTRTGAEGGEFTSVSPSLRTKFPQKPVCRPEKDGSYIRHVSLKSLSPTYDGYSMAVL